MKNQKIRTKTPCKIPHAGIIVTFYNKACTSDTLPYQAKLGNFAIISSFYLIFYTLFAKFFAPVYWGSSFQDSKTSSFPATFFAEKGLMGKGNMIYYINSEGIALKNTSSGIASFPTINRLSGWNLSSKI